jgi:type IV secretory pathway TraG/TraD family ATPase VirD4
MPWYAWGLGAGGWGLGLAILIKHLFLALTTSLHAAHQIDLLRESYKISYAFGHQRLACKEDGFVRALAAGGRGLFIGVLEGLPLFYDPFARGNGHMLVYAPARTGKTVSLAIPALLHWFGGSLVAVDIKGELAAASAAFRASVQRVLILNPFGVRGIKGLFFNPLRVLVEDILKNQGKELSALARAIAFQLIPERAGERGDGKFFRSGARRLVIAFLLYLAAFTPAACPLPKLRALV